MKKSLEDICKYAEKTKDKFKGETIYRCKANEYGVDCFRPDIYKTCYYYKKKR